MSELHLTGRTSRGWRATRCACLCYQGILHGTLSSMGRACFVCLCWQPQWLLCTHPPHHMLQIAFGTQRLQLLHELCGCTEHKLCISHYVGTNPCHCPETSSQAATPQQNPTGTPSILPQGLSPRRGWRGTWTWCFLSFPPTSLPCPPSTRTWLATRLALGDVECCTPPNHPVMVSIILS